MVFKNFVVCFERLLRGSSTSSTVVYSALNSTPCVLRKSSDSFSRWALVSHLSVRRSLIKAMMSDRFLNILSILSSSFVRMSLRVSSSLPAGSCPCCASPLTWSHTSLRCLEIVLCSRFRICRVSPTSSMARLLAKKIDWKVGNVLNFV